MRGLSDLAERYGSGEVRLSVQQNVIIPNVPETRIGALADEAQARFELARATGEIRNLIPTSNANPQQSTQK
jgi:sulfite reductase beta subunit-like hemoprotein